MGDRPVVVHAADAGRIDGDRLLAWLALGADAVSIGTAALIAVVTAAAPPCAIASPPLPLLAAAVKVASDRHKAAGNAHFKAGAYAAALASYSAGLAIDADSSVLYSNRSGAHASLANYAAALEDAERCVALRPECAKGHTRLERERAAHGKSAARGGRRRR